MRISSIPQIYRNLRRWQEIIIVLRRYGLADWLSQLKVDFIRDWIKDEQGVPLASYSRESRIRMALTDLGPTFIKLGQVLSLRPETIGPGLAAELAHLQTQVPADSFETVEAIVEQELGKPLDEVFRMFHEKPIASASIGQVHVAELLDGTQVVVKVQHANIHATIREDLEVMAGLATLAERLPELAAWKPRTLVEQLSKSLRRELNFSRELQNLQLFGAELKGFDGVCIPRPFPKFSTQRVLTMERLKGRDVSEFAKDVAVGLASRQGLARLAAEVYVEMIFVMGVYHADPHPGNVLVMAENQLGLLDFGMCGRIDDRLRETIEEMLMAVLSRDASLLTSLIKRVGRMPPRLDESSLSVDVAELISTYGTQPLAEFDLGGALTDVTDILHRHQITLPPQTSLLIKMLITLEGTLHQLAPNFSLIEVMQPFFRRMWIRRLSPRRQVKRARRIYYELENLLETLPSQVSNVMQLVQEGKLDVHLSHRGLSPSVNRLVMGMLVSALFLGSSVLLAFRVPPLLFMRPGWLGIERLSLLGVLGYVVSMLVGLRLVRAINRSGHLDHVDVD
ncbi:MAG: ABC1 kinase family protein [Aureliella sp.]